MKKLLSVILLLGLLVVISVPMVAAQDEAPAISAACEAISVTDVAPIVDLSGDYLAGEIISISFGGTGNATVDVDGNLSPVASGDTFDITIDADGTYTITVDGDATILISATCTGAEPEPDPDAEPDFPPGMICHYPPGNPENAHTITVGEPAVQTHIDKHGDTLGPCAEETDTKIENPDIGAVIFVEPHNGIVRVFSDCGEDSCGEETVIELLEQVDFTLALDDEGNFIQVEEAVQFGEIAEVGPSVVIYYLHPDPDNPALGVFQVNIYFDGVLVDDSTLLFVDAEGTIIEWTSHNVWDEE